MNKIHTEREQKMVEGANLGVLDIGEMTSPLFDRQHATRLQDGPVNQRETQCAVHGQVENATPHTQHTSFCVSKKRCRDPRPYPNVGNS